MNPSSAEWLKSGGWSDKRIALVEEMWAKGESQSKIAQELGTGCTRSMVSGKIARLDLPPRVVEVRRIPRPKPEPKPVPEPLPEPKPELSPLNISMMELTDRHCRFPTTDGDPWLFCGLPPDGSVYCEVHRKACFQPSSKAA